MKIIKICLFLLAFCSNCFASDQDVANSFKEFTGAIINEIQESFDRGDFCTMLSGVGNGKWIKLSYINLVHAIDVQKTSSIMSPYVGKLAITYNIIDYYSDKYPDGNFPTRYEAEIADKKKLPALPLDKMTRYIFTYAYQNGQWVLVKSQSCEPLLRGQYFDRKMAIPQKNCIASNRVDY